MNQEDGIILFQTEKAKKSDNFGNVLFIHIYETIDKNNRYAVLRLKLASDSKVKWIGYVDLIEGVYYCSRDSRYHFHYTTKSYGFNYNVISDTYFNIKKIMLQIDNEKNYLFPSSLLTQYGKKMNYKHQGFELQNFLAFNLIKPYLTCDKITIRHHKKKPLD
jgi:hypothetical protein